MALVRAEMLIESAQKGQKLGSKDRLHTIAYLLVTKPEVGAPNMAELFKVSIRQIYLDLKHLRQNRANTLKREDPALVLADIAISFDQQVRDMEASKSKSKLGSSNYLNHCKTIFNTQIQKVQALQSLGYYPKNLGNLTTTAFVWKADVTQDGTVSTRPVNMQFKKTNEKAFEVDYEEVVDAAPQETVGNLMLPAVLAPPEEPAGDVDLN